MNKNLHLSLVLSFVLCLLSCVSFAQAPPLTNYQAVLRDANGNVMPNQNLCVQSTITNGNAGTILYREEFTPTTNQFGLFTIELGGGIADIGTYSTIDWSHTNPWQKVDVKINCTGAYITMGNAQLLTVPYAFSAVNAQTSADNHWALTGNAIYNTNSGNVGIGTTLPTASLDISTQVIQPLKVNGSGTGYGAGFYKAGTYQGYIGSLLTNNLEIGASGATTNLSFNTRDTGRVIITPAGLVGVGTSTPGALLHTLVGSGNKVVALFENTNATNTSNTVTINNASAAQALLVTGSNSAVSYDLAKFVNSSTALHDVVAVHGISTPAGNYGFGGRFEGSYYGAYCDATANNGSNASGTGVYAKGGYRGVSGNATSTSILPIYGIDGHTTGGGTGSAAGYFYTFNGGTYGTYSVVDGGPGLPGNNATWGFDWGSFSNINTGSYNTVANPATGTATALAFGSYNLATHSGNSQNSGVFGYGANGSIENVGGYFMGSGPSTASNYGVIAEASGPSTTSNVGVYAEASGANNYAGQFVGNVHVNGTLSKSGGTFKIDHPQDPENKYLIHSFVESPDMMNIYNGNITTDGAGNAEVNLPSYFNAENKDFRYQLTVISGGFAQAIVAEKINGNRFLIKTDKPNIEVSWMVTGVRQDKWADANRVVPEVEKEAPNKGKYLHPELYGKSDDLQIGKPALKGKPSDVKQTFVIPNEQDNKSAK